MVLVAAHAIDIAPHQILVTTVAVTDTCTRLTRRVPATSRRASPRGRVKIAGTAHSLPGEAAGAEAEQGAPNPRRDAAYSRCRTRALLAPLALYIRPDSVSAVQLPVDGRNGCDAHWLDSCLECSSVTVRAARASGVVTAARSRCDGRPWQAPSDRSPSKTNSCETMNMADRVDCYLREARG